ncbi:MAG: CotH kinase family protein [Rikenellaceae bacterium]
MRKIYIITFVVLIVGLHSCRNHDYIAEQESTDNYDNDSEAYDTDQEDLETFPDWAEYTHGNSTEPQYMTVFGQDASSQVYGTLLTQSEVKKIYITLSSSSWSSMLSDLSSNYRYINTSGSDYTPIWQPCTITFDDTDWYKVGVRFKGNSSLSQTYSSGNRKLSLKLDFDQYEDDYPALKNQRFYGFKQLNLNSNYNDESLMREKVGADLFRAFGLAAAHTAFYEVYIDNTGSGTYDYYGLYTLVEEVDDTVIKNQFTDSSGNLYKPDGDAASFKSGTYDTSELYLKTNTSSPDYSDAKALYDVLNTSSNRTSNTEVWQASLESIFNVQIFLKWLAANAVIQNWDTYGNMTHNYYLYNAYGVLTWIPWDNNEAFQSGSGQYSSIEVSKMGSVSSSWPLISYLYNVEEYVAMYEEYLQAFVDDVFVTAELQALYTTYYDLLLSSASSEESGKTFFDSSTSSGKSSEFSSAVTTLKTHASSRVTTVNNYLK